MKGIRASWKVAAAGALTAVTALASAAALAAFLGAGAPPFNGTGLGFSEPHDRRAAALIASDRSADALAAAEAETRKALALSPYNNAARLRLAYIDTRRRGGSLGPVALKHLTRSYDLVPLDHTVAAWRVGFALEHWAELTPEVRLAVQAEAVAFARMRSRDANVTEALRNVRSPEGRLAVALWRRTLRH